MEEEESLQLLTDLEPIFSPFKSEGQACVLKNEVTSTYSRCIACYHGQGIKRFDYNYLNIDAPQPYNQIVYKNSFGVYIGEMKNRLANFRVCNAFLEDKDLQELGKFS
ncbi:MAG: hypothetical protein L0J63_07995 [Tetragenococcus koreensis]|nr:hypothetical protein [Tetragenococcus koreensis]